MKLPALREVGALAEYQETPGSNLMGFLAFLRSELLQAIENLRDETLEKLDDGDPASRIQVINRLRLRKNRIEGHLIKEIREVRELTRSLWGQSDKSIVDTLNNESKVVVETIVQALKELVEEFGLD